MASSSPMTLVGQAVAELHMGRLEEAEVALQQALDKEPTNADALANGVVLATLAGKAFTEQIRYAKSLQKYHEDADMVLQCTGPSCADASAPGGSRAEG